MSNTKEFNVRHAQHNLASLLEAAERGEKVRITRRGKVVAQLGPPEPDPGQLSWPDASSRLAEVFCGKALIAKASELGRVWMRDIGGCQSVQG